MTTFAHFDSPKNAALFEEYYSNALEMWSDQPKTLDLPTSFGTTRVVYLPRTESEGIKNGVPVVLLHGFGATSLMWQRIMPILARDRDCYAIDIMGQVGSSVPTGKSIKRMKHYMQWLREVMDNLELSGNKINLVGYSYGGHLASRYAVKYIDEIRSLVLIEPALVFSSVRINFMLFFLGIYQSQTLRARGEDLQQYLRDSSYYNPYFDRAIILANQHFIAGKMVLPKPLKVWKLAELNRRLMVILGDDSEVLHARRTQRFAKFFTPKAQIIEFEEGTHAIPSEFAYEISELMRAMFTTYL